MPSNKRGRAEGTPLSQRQYDTLILLAEGDTPEIIAEIFGVKRNTVDAFVTQLRDKLGAKTTAHAIAIAYDTGLLFIPEKKEV